MWSRIEEYLRSQGFTEVVIVRILEEARVQDLDPAKVDRVLAASEGEEVRLLH
jgi:hypothetical protein